MKKKIVIIEHEPLTPRVFKIFNINEFRLAGYIVEYRDISQLLYPGMKMPDEIKDDRLLKIYNIQEYIKSLEIDNSNETIYIAEMQNVWKNRKLFRILKQKKSVVVRLNLYSTMILPLSFIEKIILHKGKYFKLLISKIEQFAYNIYQLICNFKPYDIEITSHSELKSTIQVFTINHPDFELAKSLTDTESIVSGPYAVFLDEYFPFHPDFEFYSNIKFSENIATSYQQKMCKFFDKIEANYKLKVVIAAHPKSTYEDGVFGHRTLIKYRTCELVRDSQFVILHGSASFDFAVIYKKPLIITCMNYFSKYLDMKKRSAYLSSFFSCPLVNLDNEGYDIPEPNIDIVACNDFLYTYMTSPENEIKKNIEKLKEVFDGI